MQHPNNAKRTLYALCEGLELRPLNFHAATRHTFVSVAWDAGVPTEDTSRPYGHESVEFTRRTYCYLFDTAAPLISFNEYNPAEQEAARAERQREAVSLPYSGPEI